MIKYQSFNGLKNVKIRQCDSYANQAHTKKKINTRKKKVSHLKVGMFSSFGGTGPENKLFSTFLIRVRE
jgi:hypothetical protein